MTSRDFALHTRLMLGQGSLARVPEIVDGDVFLVTDPGVVAAGHPARLESLFAAKGIAVHRYDDVQPNPTEQDVEACLAAFRTAFVDKQANWIVALGGGSAIDVAKGCAMLACGGGRISDYVGRGKIDVQHPKLIAIPTTAGTGSETQSFALIGNRDTGQKMACGGTAPFAAILDPELTLTQPRAVAACTGLDTLAHAVETFVTRRRSDVSVVFSREAFRLAERNFATALAQPEDLDARTAMLHASALAGIAIENSMLGAAHSMANPLTRHFDIAHGQAVGQVLPAVIACNATDSETAALYADLARGSSIASKHDPDATAVARLIARVRELVAQAGFGPTIEGVPSSAIDKLAAEAATQWTAQFNPRDVDAATFRELFHEVLP